MEYLRQPAIELNCRGSTDWFQVSQQYDAFRLLWNNREGRGREEFYRLNDDIWLRLLNLNSASGCVPIRRPSGYITLACKLEGFNIIESDSGEAFSLSANQVLCSYRQDDTSLLDRCPAPDRYLMVVLMIAPNALLKSPFQLLLHELPELFRSPLEKHESESNTILCIGSKLRHCLLDILSPPDFPALLYPYLNAKIGEFLCLLLSECSIITQEVAASTPLMARDRRALTRLCQTLRTDFAKPPPLPQLSRFAGMSESKLKQRFKAFYGCSISTFTQRLRMQHAKEMLERNDFNISQIAEAVGYAHAANFITAFKREYGTTPLAFRKALHTEVV